MAISDKILYLNDTKKLLKQEINKSTEITDEDTFRSYAPKIYDGYLDLLNNGTDTLWNNLEKVSASGETPILENVETAPMKMVLNGNTSQKIIPKDAGKEVIDTNIAITDVDTEKEGYIELNGNTSQDTTSGKNLIAPNNLIETTVSGVTFTPIYEGKKLKYINVNGTSTSLISYDVSTIPLTLQAGTYFLSGCPTGGGNSTYELGLRYASFPRDLGNGVVLNLSAEATYSNCRIVIQNGVTVNNQKFYPMLEKGSTATSYEPYTGGIPSPNPDYPQQVKVVKGENVVSVNGKNLIPNQKSNATSQGVTFTANEDGTYLISGKNSGGGNSIVTLFSRQNYILEPKTYYTIPTNNERVTVVLFVTYEDNTNQYININKGVQSSVKINKKVIQANAYLQVARGATETFTDYKVYPILSETPVDIESYEPYSKTDYSMNLGDIELYKIGDYKDYFHKDNGKWYVHKEINKVVLDGTENWPRMNAKDNHWRFRTFKYNNIADIMECYSNNFKYNGDTWSHEGINTVKSAIWIRNDELFTTESDLKTWLSTHNTIVYYILATPTEEEITNIALIEQLDALYTAKLVNSTTYISTIANNLKPFIDLNYNVVTPSPSPERPSEVKVVKGENVVSVSGKNLFDKDNATIIQGYFDYSHTSITSTSSNRTIYLKVKPNTIYSVSKLVSTRNWLGTTQEIPTINTQVSNISNFSGGNYTYDGITRVNTTITTGANDSYIVLNYTNTNSETGEIPTAILNSIQIEEGSTATEYEPYSKTDYPINLVSKNLFDKDNQTKIQVNAEGTLRYGIIVNAPNKKVSISGENWSGYIAYKPLTNGAYGQWVNINQDTSINVTDKLIIYSNGDTIKLDTYVDDLQIEISDAPTNYEPYFTPIELCKINTYKDYFHKDSGKWYVHKEIGKVVLDGSESWKQSSVADNVHNILLNDMLPPTTNAEIYINGISNTFLNGASYNNLTAVTTYMNYYNRMSATYDKYMSFSYEFTTSINDWKNWLSTHNIIAYYVLATPTEEEITNTTLIEQLETLYTAKLMNSTTYISTIADNLEPFIDLNYNVVIPSPSPEKPSEVKVVKGENVVSVSGKNLVDIENIKLGLGNIQEHEQGNNYVRVTTKEAQWANMNFNIFLEAGTYYYEHYAVLDSEKIYTNGIGSLRISPSEGGVAIINQSVEGNYLNKINNITFTIKESGVYTFVYRCANSQANVRILNINNIILSKTKTDFIPYSKIDYPIDLIAKNIFDKDNANILNAWIDKDTKQCKSANDSRTIYIPCTPNTKYGISKIHTLPTEKERFRIGTTTDEPTTLPFNLNQVVQDDNAEEIIITTGANDNYLVVFFYNTSSTITFEEVLASLKIVRGGGYFDIELRKIGDYKDYFHKDSSKWYKHKEINKVVLNGTENWQVGNVGINKVRKFYLYGATSYIPKNIKQYSNYAEWSSAVYNYGYGNMFQIEPSKNLIIVASDNMTLTQFKEKLNTTPMVVYYILATPTEEEITNSILIEQLEAISKAKSVKDKTYITQTNDELPFVLDVEAIKEYEENLDNN